MGATALRTRDEDDEDPLLDAALEIVTDELVEWLLPVHTLTPEG